MQRYAPLLGRILFSAAFIVFGLGHFGDAEMMAQTMVPAFVPAKVIVVYLTGLWILAGGLMVLVGYRARIGALMLFAFLVATSFMVWAGQFDAQPQVAMAMFMKDLALAGGALMIYHFGSGPLSLDNRNAAG